MNISKNFKIMSIFALAIAATAGSYAQDSVRSEFVTTDQPFVIFKAIKGAKNPVMFKCYPGVNELDVVYFGTQKKSGVKLVKTTKDCENLAPLRFTMKFADNTPVQIDKKYAGCREAYLGVALENIFKTVGLYPSDGYNGQALVDEYKSGLPMKWVLSSAEYFKSLKKYMLKGFNAANIVAPEAKPLLLIEIINTQNGLDASDYEFLNQYFEVLDPRDPLVKKFFEGAGKTIASITEKTKEAINVGTESGEAFLSGVEKSAKEFDVKKIRDYVLPMGVVAVGTYILSQVKGGAKHWADGQVWKKGLGKKEFPADKDGKEAMAKEIAGWYGEKAVDVAIYCGVIVGSYLTYKLITDFIINVMEDAEDDDIELIEKIEKIEETQA